MKRYLSEHIRIDLGKKIVLLTGPRQVGKTTLSKDLMAGYQHPQYLNWDVSADRRLLLDQSWSLRTDLLVLDEIHKMPDWKAYLKGVFDGRPAGQAILVTGSARMETFRQSGESLAGRYFQAHLHPFSVREWVELNYPGESFEPALFANKRWGGGRFCALRSRRPDSSDRMQTCGQSTRPDVD